MSEAGRLALLDDQWADQAPAWESKAAVPVRGHSMNIKPKRKIAMLLKPMPAPIPAPAPAPASASVEQEG